MTLKRFKEYSVTPFKQCVPYWAGKYPSCYPEYDWAYCLPNKNGPV